MRISIVESDWRSEIDEPGFYRSLREVNQTFLGLETYGVGDYQGSVKHRHYYQVTNGILEFEINELSFNHSLGDELNSF